MEKEFTNGELMRISAKLEAATSKDIVMPPKVAYKIVKNKLAIKQVLQAFETARNEIIDRESGGKSTVDAEENPQLFDKVNRAITEIALERVSLDIVTISLDDIPESGVPISFIAALDFMIEEG